MAGTGSNTVNINEFKKSFAITLDKNDLIYVSNQENHRVQTLTLGSLTGTTLVEQANDNILISDNDLDHGYGIVLVSDSSDQIYRWKFDELSSNLVLSEVNDNPSQFEKSAGLILDPYGNLYVADSDKHRLIMYCTSSTVHSSTKDTIVIQDTNTIFKRSIKHRF